MNRYAAALALVLLALTAGCKRGSPPPTPPAPSYQPLPPPPPDQPSRREPTARDLQDAVSVDFCDLVRAPLGYDGKVVRVSAEYKNGFDRSTLSLARCGVGAGHVWVWFWVKWDSPPAMRLVARFQAREFVRADVTFVGEMRAEPGRRYGNLNSCQSQLAVFAVERAELLTSRR
jgi:hypothetical protein